MRSEGHSEEGRSGYLRLFSAFLLGAFAKAVRAGRHSKASVQGGMYVLNLQKLASMGSPVPIVDRELQRAVILARQVFLMFSFFRYSFPQ